MSYTGFLFSSKVFLHSNLRGATISVDILIYRLELRFIGYNIGIPLEIREEVLRTKHKWSLKLTSAEKEQVSTS
jgi:hypothetical protein